MGAFFMLPTGTSSFNTGCVTHLYSNQLCSITQSGVKCFKNLLKCRYLVN